MIDLAGIGSPHHLKGQIFEGKISSITKHFKTRGKKICGIGSSTRLGVNSKRMTSPIVLEASPAGETKNTTSVGTFLKKESGVQVVSFDIYRFNTCAHHGGPREEVDLN